MTKATAESGGQASIGDIVNRTNINGLIGQVAGNNTVVIQHLHITTGGTQLPGNAGLVGYFGLLDWWNDVLSPAERGALEDAIGDDVVRSRITTTNRSAPSWLRSTALRIAAVHPNLASKLRAKASGIETGIEIDDYWQHQLETVRRHWLIMDFEQARADLRDIAYRMREENALAEDKAAYSRLLVEFMRADPYYTGVMDVVLPIIKSRPGVIQATLARGLPQFDIDRYRHAMYYGEIIGDIKRVKQGRSYGLYIK